MGTELIFGSLFTSSSEYKAKNCISKDISMNKDWNYSFMIKCATELKGGRMS